MGPYETLLALIVIAAFFFAGAALNMIGTFIIMLRQAVDPRRVVILTFIAALSFAAMVGGAILIRDASPTAKKVVPAKSLSRNV